MLLDAPPPENERMSREDIFAFSCHSGLDCFNTCCRNKYLPLTPYDVLRMRQALQLHSDEFLARYVLYRTDPDTGFPVLSLKMNGEDNLCPFVSVDGCGIYEHRPMACRLYPLGRSSTTGGDFLGPKEFFYLLDTPGCQGIYENKIQQVQQWEESQGLSPYIDMNDQMLSILFHAKRNRSKPLDQKQQQKILVACYNIDTFRDLVATPRFIETFHIDPETSDKVAQDDIALLRLGFAYLNIALFP
ncbi:MAG: YkgJ family cysteine cluster protein [Thermodesulfobacteriota bacterium]